MREEHTFLAVTPYGDGRYMSIIRHLELELRGVRWGNLVEAIVTEEVARRLYRGLVPDEAAFSEVAASVIGRPFRFLTLYGKGGYDEVLRVVGQSLNPNECGPETIRCIFDSKRPLRLTTGFEFYPTVVLAPTGLARMIDFVYVMTGLRSE